MNKKVVDALGMALLSLPTTKNNRTNNERRNVKNMESVSAAQMIGVTRIDIERPMIFCGKHNKAIPVLRQLVKKANMPFVIVGTPNDLRDESCLRLLETEWESDRITPALSDGNGILCLQAGAETDLGLNASLAGWASHYIILCIGNGIQVDEHIMKILNGIGHYILVSESLPRSIASVDGTKMTPADLLASMDSILVSAIGTAAKNLQEVLPNYECERVTNSTDLSFHQDAPHDNRGDYHHRNGGGLRFSQSKTLESRNIFTHEDLIKLQDTNELIVHNTQTSHTWLARISS